MTGAQYSENREYNVHFQLSEHEAKIFESYRTRIGCSNAGAIICLIRGSLMQKSELHNNALQDILDDKVLERLDRDFDSIHDTIRCLCQQDERQDEQIISLEDKFDRLAMVVSNVLELVKLTNQDLNLEVPTENIEG